MQNLIKLKGMTLAQMQELFDKNPNNKLKAKVCYEDAYYDPSKDGAIVYPKNPKP